MNTRNELAFPLDGSNHRSICKFRMNEDQRFSAVGDAILDLAELSLRSAQGQLGEQFHSSPLSWSLADWLTDTTHHNQQLLALLLRLLLKEAPTPERYEPIPKGPMRIPAITFHFQRTSALLAEGQQSIRSKTFYSPTGAQEWQSLG